MAAPKKRKKVLAPKKKVSLKKKLVKVVKKVKKVKRIVKSKIVRKTSKKPLKLKKVLGNPILEPSSYNWESKATMNPAAFLSGKKVHLVYRAIGDDDSSALGYAGSTDGYSISERLPYSIYRRFFSFVREGDPIDYVSGGGWNGGCEDPRLTKIGDRVYMLYTAFDGWGSVRITLTSIALQDFEKKKWNWSPAVPISPPGEVHKNWVLFPEKINGKFAVLHSISPKILVDYVDRMEDFNGKRFIKSHHAHTPEWKTSWDGSVRGVGPAPIKTSLGWLIFYHAMDHRDPNRYKLGAMILDLKDPTKILYHLDEPVLEPDQPYENWGYKWGVVYACGAVEKDGMIFVYYGGADKVICVATIPLSELLQALKENKVVKLKKIARI